MYLSGVTQARQISYQQNRTVEGASVLSTVPTPGGRVLALETTQLNGAIQGIWCQAVIDDIKLLEAVNNVVDLVDNGVTYSVKIVDTTQLSQLLQFEPVSPTKKYIGRIEMIEV